MDWTDETWAQLPDVAPVSVGRADVPEQCRPLRERLDGIRETIGLLQAELAAATPADKPAIVAEIRRAQNEQRAAAAQLDRCLAAARSYLDITGVEYTQAVQYFLHNGQGSGAARPNSLPSVAGKPLIIRVYVALRRGRPPHPSSVSGTLEYRRPGGATFPPLSPVGNPITPREQPDIDRGLASHTLNFRIPAAHCQGRLAFTLRLFDLNNPAFEVTTALNPREFRAVPPLRLHGVLVRYTGNGLDLAAPTAQELMDSLTYLVRTYPIGAVQYTGCTEIEFDGDLTTGGDGCGDGWDELLDVLAGMRAASATNDIYLGLLPTGTPTSKFSGCGRGGVCAAVTGRQILVAHEIGHSLSRRHVAGCKDPNNVDGNYPDYAGYPEGSIGEFGINAATMAVRDPAEFRDFMSYCDKRWISPYTYQGIMNRLVALGTAADIDDAEVRTVVQELLHLNLRVRGDQVLLLPSFHLSGPSGAPTSGVLTGNAPGRFSCDLLDADGSVLTHHRCRSDDPHRPADADDVDLHEVLPWDPTVRTIAVRRDGALVGTVGVAAEPPVVRMSQAPRQVANRDGVVRVEWEADASAATGSENPTTYVLRYSNDGGATWRAVGAHLAKTGRNVNLGLLPGGQRCRFQVVAARSVATSTVETADFPVERKPRRAHLVTPTQDLTVREGTPMTLRGGGFSPDLGVTEAGDIVWASNLDGVLGVGFEVITQALSVGRHRITVTVPDGLGGDAADSVSIEVLPGE